MLIIILISLLTCGVSASVEQQYQDCGPVGTYKVNQVLLDVDCKNGPPCCLPLNIPAVTTISFKATNIPAEDLKPSVYAVIEGSKKDGEVIPSNCPADVCPIYPDDEKTYMPQFIFRQHMDPVLVKLYWNVMNYKDQQLFCFYIPLIFYDPTSDDCPVLLTNSTLF